MVWFILTTPYGVKIKQFFKTLSLCFGGLLLDEKKQKTEFKSIALTQKQVKKNTSKYQVKLFDKTGNFCYKYKHNGVKVKFLRWYFSPLKTPPPYLLLRSFFKVDFYFRCDKI